MDIKTRIEQDLKQAMLAGDKLAVSCLRGLKSVILYAEVAKGARENGLGDAEVTTLLAKESKKRQESAELYAQGGNSERQANELAEKAIIDGYLPAQLSETEIDVIIDQVIKESTTTAAGPPALGLIIGKVKERTQGAADGAVIAKLVKGKLG